MLGLIDQSTGESWMRWTVRFAVACVFARFLLRLHCGARNRGIPSTGECWLWGIGCAAYVSHVVLAFHFVHGWSHDHAWTHTADETERVTGIHRGEGIWANYLFTIIWIVDVIRILRARLQRRPTSGKLESGALVVFAFMLLNATVVFGPGHYRIIAIPAILALFLTWHHGRTQRHGSPS